MAMINGKILSVDVLANLAKQVQANALKPRLHIFTASHNDTSNLYVAKKQTVASEIGVVATVHHYDPKVAQDDIRKLVVDQVLSDSRAGVMIQLPLPNQLDVSGLVSCIPAAQDVDVLNRTVPAVFGQPVAASVQHCLEYAGYSADELATLPERSVHVVGQGFLVGVPVIDWLQSIGVEPVVYKKGDDLSTLQNASVIITGVGKPGLITADMISDGVVLIDAGTSTDAGNLYGDVHPNCYPKSAHYTPVPGGVGPLTLAFLMKNVVDLATRANTPVWPIEFAF